MLILSLLNMQIFVQVQVIFQIVEDLRCLYATSKLEHTVYDRNIKDGADAISSAKQLIDQQTNNGR